MSPSASALGSEASRRIQKALHIALTLLVSSSWPLPQSGPGVGPTLLSAPAKVQQRPRGGRGALCRPAEEVELRERARLLGLHILQVEAPHEEVLAPDVLRH